RGNRSPGLLRGRGAAWPRRQDEEVCGTFQRREDEGGGGRVERRGCQTAGKDPRVSGEKGRRDAVEPADRDQAAERGKPEPARASEGTRGTRVGCPAQGARTGREG